MSFKKKVLAFAAVSALSAATAVPAMALENEFHGIYKMKYFVSNFDNGSAGMFGAPQLFPVSPALAATARVTPGEEKVSAMNYFEQRARIIYGAKANDHLKLVVGFEIDSVFGDRSQGSISAAGTPAAGTAFRNSGGALDTDAVNLETKWVHLDFDIPNTPTNVKVGTQAIKDSIKGVLFDADAAGIYTASKFGAGQVNVGYFRGYEGITADTGGLGSIKRGVNNLDIAIFEGKYNVSKDLAVGAAYYGLYDYRQAAATMLLHTAALNADTKLGPVALSGFVAAQFGELENKTTNVEQDLHGLAANVAAKVKVGPGSLKGAFLYTSGDRRNGTGANNNSWQSLQQSLAGVQSGAGLNNLNMANSGSLNTYNESGMMLLNRNAAAGGTTTDREIVFTTNNHNQGMTAFFVGYDAAFTPKFYGNVNAGGAFTSCNNATQPLNRHTGRANGSQYLGTEVNLETGYKLYDNLTASVQAAYVFLGDYYKGTASDSTVAKSKDPMDPYTARIVLSYAF